MVMTGVVIKLMTSMSSRDISWGELGWYSWSIAITFMMSLSVILFQLGVRFVTPHNYHRANIIFVHEFTCMLKALRMDHSLYIS
jgi:hypothetical protein